MKHASQRPNFEIKSNKKVFMVFEIVFTIISILGRTSKIFCADFMLIRYIGANT